MVPRWVFHKVTCPRVILSLRWYKSWKGRGGNAFKFCLFFWRRGSKGAIQPFPPWNLTQNTRLRKEESKASLVQLGGKVPDAESHWKAPHVSLASSQGVLWNTLAGRREHSPILLIYKWGKHGSLHLLLPTYHNFILSIGDPRNKAISQEQVAHANCHKRLCLLRRLEYTLKHHTRKHAVMDAKYCSRL